MLQWDVSKMDGSKKDQSNFYGKLHTLQFTTIEKVVNAWNKEFRFFSAHISSSNTMHLLSTRLWIDRMLKSLIQFEVNTKCVGQVWPTKMFVKVSNVLEIDCYLCCVTWQESHDVKNQIIYVRNPPPKFLLNIWPPTDSARGPCWPFCCANVTDGAYEKREVHVVFRQWLLYKSYYYSLLVNKMAFFAVWLSYSTSRAAGCNH